MCYARQKITEKRDRTEVNRSGEAVIFNLAAALGTTSLAAMDLERLTRPTAATRHRQPVFFKGRFQPSGPSPYLTAAAEPGSFRHGGNARTAPNLTADLHARLYKAPHSRPAPRLLDLAQTTHRQQHPAAASRPRSAAATRQDRRQIIEAAERRILAAEQQERERASTDRLASAARRLDDSESTDAVAAAAAAAAAAGTAMRTRIERPASAGATLMRRAPSSEQLRVMSDKFGGPSATAPPKPPSYHEASSAPPEAAPPPRRSPPPLATATTDGSPPPHRASPQRPRLPSYGEADQHMRNSTTAAELRNTSSRCAWDASSTHASSTHAPPRPDGPDRPGSAAAARREAALNAAAAAAAATDAPPMIQNEMTPTCESDMAAASAAISVAAASAATALSAAAAAASSLAAMRQSMPPPPPPQHQTSATAAPSTSADVPTPHGAARAPPTYLSHTFSSGGSTILRPASANQRARAAASATAPSAAAPSADPTRPTVRQRPSSASIRRPAHANAPAGAPQYGGGMLTGGGAGNGGSAVQPEAWFAQRQHESGTQRAEIDALRRRTQALQNGATMAQRLSAGPAGLTRSRPSSASHRGRAAEFLERRAAGLAGSAAAGGEGAARVSVVSHRPAPTRPPDARSREPPAPHAMVADIDTDEEDEAPLNVGQYRRQAQRSLMLSHLRESSASFPGLAQIDWAHLDNQGLHAAVSAIVRVHTALQASGAHNSAEAVAMQQQLSALYKKSGGAGLTEEQLSVLPTFACDEKRLCQLVEAERTTCAICHDEMCQGQELRCLPGCDHTYHANCIGHWLRIKAACPLCNQKVKV